MTLSAHPADDRAGARAPAGMSIRFWGVRGSIAAAGERTAQVGGNTPCVEVRHGGEILVLDAGTGLRGLGERLLAGGAPGRVALLLSHLHWDHIQGFPFFRPAYLPGWQVDLYGPHDGGDLRRAFAAQMQAPHFPVGLEAMRGALAFHTLGAHARLRFGDVEVRTAPARHPNGCLAYRLSAGGRSVVYATDTEHDAEAGTLDAELVALARGADVLIYDAQYTPLEYDGGGGGPSRRGWGHSTAAEGVRLARAAGVGELVLFHHDPARDDEAVARIEQETRALFPCTRAAREGLELLL